MGGTQHIGQVLPHDPHRRQREHSQQQVGGGGIRWLAAVTALAEGGPGTAASAADLAAYVRDYDPGESEDPDDAEPGEEDEPDDFFLSDDDDEFDDLTMEGLFVPVTSLRQVLGATDDDERLTALGWWGLPEAMLRV